MESALLAAWWWWAWCVLAALVDPVVESELEDVVESELDAVELVESDEDDPLVEDEALVAEEVPLVEVEDDELAEVAPVRSSMRVWKSVSSCCSQLLVEDEVDSEEASVEDEPESAEALEVERLVALEGGGPGGGPDGGALEPSESLASLDPEDEEPLASCARKAANEGEIEMALSLSDVEVEDATCVVLAPLDELSDEEALVWFAAF